MGEDENYRLGLGLGHRDVIDHLLLVEKHEKWRKRRKRDVTTNISMSSVNVT